MLKSTLDQMTQERRLLEAALEHESLAPIVRSQKVARLKEIKKKLNSYYLKGIALD